jgi:hypothetical protein
MKNFSQGLVAYIHSPSEPSVYMAEALSARRRIWKRPKLFDEHLRFQRKLSGQSTH